MADDCEPLPGTDDNQQSSTEGNQKSRWRRAWHWLRAAWSRLRATAWNGDCLYNELKQPAKWLKAVVQMAIGIATIPTILVLVWIPGIRGDHGIANFALRIVAVSLALAAVVELAYTLLTPGPDEALDPLILGLSSFVLVQISKPDTPLNTSASTSIILLLLALAGLFVMREVFIERPKRSRKGEKESRETERENSALGQEQTPPL